MEILKDGAPGECQELSNEGCIVSVGQFLGDWKAEGGIPKDS